MLSGGGCLRAKPAGDINDCRKGTRYKRASALGMAYPPNGGAIISVKIYGCLSYKLVDVVGYLLYEVGAGFDAGPSGVGCKD